MQLNRLVFVLGLFAVFLLFDPNAAGAQGFERKKDYYPNGNVKVAGSLKNGQMIGIWTYYYPHGKLSTKEKYSKGKFLWRIDFDQSGKKIRGINAAGDTTLYKNCNCKN
ncbi:MAG: hypothetical protein KA981_12180 [Bacteroidia bacterium]|nr:hypothetical protein [Bacteroidia bacterium]